VAYHWTERRNSNAVVAYQPPYSHIVIGLLISDVCSNCSQSQSLLRICPLVKESLAIIIKFTKLFSGNILSRT
jgi:hypothetical protein